MKPPSLPMPRADIVAVPEPKQSSNPLKRFGTVLSRRRQSVHPYGRASSPERKSSSNLTSAFGGFGKGKAKERDNGESSANRPVSPLRRLSSRNSATPRASDVSASPKQSRQSDHPNGSTLEPVVSSEGGPSVNGTAAHETIPELKEPFSPPPAAEAQPEVGFLSTAYKKNSNPVQPEKDAEGFSVPPSAIDAITEAEREAGL